MCHFDNLISSGSLAIDPSLFMISHTTPSSTWNNLKLRLSHGIMGNDAGPP